jgi:hypothetical protein
MPASETATFAGPSVGSSHRRSIAGPFRRGTVGSSAYRRSRVNTTNPSWRLTLMAECTPGAEPLKRWVT